MSKKQFKSELNSMKFGTDRKDAILAIFFDRKSGYVDVEVPEPYDYAKHIRFKKGDFFAGYKYCIYARMANATKKVLEDTLYDFINCNIIDVPWYIQLVVAEKDYQRFQIPLSSSALRTLIKFPSQV